VDTRVVEDRDCSSGRMVPSRAAAAGITPSDIDGPIPPPDDWEK